MNCLFCASGLNGFVRNLSCGEILGQIVAVNKYLGGTLKDRQITNVVLMGSGEPLDNFDNVKKFLKILTSDDCFNMSVRNISVSTCGIPSKIEELADLGYAVTLCLSLHASNDSVRKEIMPIAKRYSIKEIISALEYYYTMTNRRIIIEYTLIEGVNNSFKHAKELSEVLSDLPCHVNLIKLNEVDGRELKSPTADSCKKFLDTLNRFGVSATQRRTLGDDIEGACGQLRNKELQGEKVVNKVNPNIKPKPNRNTLNKVKDASQLLKQKQSKDVSSKNNARNNGRTENKSFSKKDNSRVNKQNKPFANSKGRNQNNFSNKNNKRG
jgi:23S rRNA (adenine2503-C2)-methyltransferase